MSEVVHRPTPVAGAVAVLAGAVSVWLVATTPRQRGALAITVLGVGALVVGGRLTLAARNRSGGDDGAAPATGLALGGGVLAALGGAVALAGIGLGAVEPVGYGRRVELLPGLLGVALLGLAVLPARRRHARRLASAGLAALVIGVVMAGLFRDAETLSLLLAGVAAIVAWDAAEHAIGLGEQLRTDAHTVPVELVHVGGTATYGVGVAGLAIVLYGMGSSGLPLAGLALLLAAAVTYMAALYS